MGPRRIDDACCARPVEIRSRRTSPTDSEASRIARLIHVGKRSGYIRLTWRGIDEVFRRLLRACRESSPFLGSDRRVVAMMTRYSCRKATTVIVAHFVALSPSTVR